MSTEFLTSLVLMGIAGIVFAGLFALIAGRKTTANTIVQWLFAASSLAGLIGAAFLFQSFIRGSVAGFSTMVPWIHLPLTLDVWSAGFLILINLGTLLASIFAIGYLPTYEKTYNLSSLNVVSALFILGMQATVLASSVFVFLFFWEVMSIAAYFLVIADREEASFKAGFIYFVMTHLGVACLFAGFLILANGNVMATFATLHANAAGMPSTKLALAFFLLFAGFGSKAGLVPLHQWLPYAHPQAPSHSSALMSGVMLKVAVYGFLRIALGVFPQIPLTWAIIVTVIGLVSAFFGVLSAAVETDLKRLLAWSSVENLGLIFAMIGSGFAFQAFGLPATPFFAAAFLHALNHTIFKSGLFLAAGAVISKTHTRDLDEMGGLAKAWPWMSASFLGLVFAAAALPPFGTFYGEWMFMQGLASNLFDPSKTVAFLSGVILSITALIGGLAIFTFAKTFAAIFLSKPRSEHAAHVTLLSRFMTWPIAITGVASIAVGVFAAPLVSRVGFSAPLQVAGGSIAPMMVMGLVLVLGAITFIGRRLFTTSRPIRVTDTWDCGQPINARMEYTATGFAAPIRFFFRSILLSRKSMIVEPVTPGNAWIARRRLEWSTQSIWEEWVYQPIASATLATSTWIKRLQNGVIQFYILLILVTLILVLLFAV